MGGRNGEAGSGRKQADAEEEVTSGDGIHLEHCERSRLTKAVRERGGRKRRPHTGTMELDNEATSHFRMCYTIEMQGQHMKGDLAECECESYCRSLRLARSSNSSLLPATG